MIQKQAIDISFAEGLDTKTDPKQVDIGKFLSLQNTVFDKGGALQKRNGFEKLQDLPDTSSTYLTTLNGNLTAIGPTIQAYSEPSADWVTKGKILPLTVNTLPLIRNNYNQSNADSVVAPNGLVCTVYTESDGVTEVKKVVIADSNTGQNVLAPSIIDTNTIFSPRVFYLGTNFVILYTNLNGTNYDLTYITINAYDVTFITGPTILASDYTPTTRLSFDGVVNDSRLFIAYYTNVGGSGVAIKALDANLAQTVSQLTLVPSPVVAMSVCFDPITNDIYANWSADNGHVYGIRANYVLTFISTAHLIIGAGSYNNVTASAYDGFCRVVAESTAASPFLVTAKYASDFTGIVITQVIRSVGLASKSFLYNQKMYVLTIYPSQFQPTYFLVSVSESTSANPYIVAKLAYSNAGQLSTAGLASALYHNDQVKIAYLYKDLVQAQNKNIYTPPGTAVAQVYSQTGINLASFTVDVNNLNTVELANVLQIGGGFLWLYDGYLPVEHNFFLWPDYPITATWSETGGNMDAKPLNWVIDEPSYYYQITYEWTDNQGNAYKSAPSIPIPVITTGNGHTGKVTLSIPTLRLTMKTANPVKICVYRWSTAQQTFFQTGNNNQSPIFYPVMNSTVNDAVTFTDKFADSSILGNNIIYTTGGVVEDLNAPASNLMTIFDTRLWLVSSEDRNLLWFSKTVIEATPVEMTDLFTVYVPPATSTQGPTGPITAIAPMDDKLIIFKENAAYYINGTGPDNTGANNQYSPTTFITSTVGCKNQHSILLMPKGLMFQSDKGIWLISRGLETTYIGAPVERLTQGATVTSAVNVPETNMVRFTLDSGITLTYDYFYEQWGSFTGIANISSCIWQERHTFINQFGSCYREKPGSYLDGSNPVLIQFRTGPLRLGNLQNYQRAYFFYLLGTYLSPHKIFLKIYYDYANSPEQTLLITPDNYSTPYGSGLSQSPYGQESVYGGPLSLENWRVFLQRQRCMAFSIELQEIYDASKNEPAGAGFTLSGLNVVCGFKSQFRPQEAALTVG